MHALHALIAIALPAIAAAQTVEWVRQFGGAAHDRAQAVAVAASGVYVAGATEGALPGQQSAGAIDAFVRKYGPDGAEIWTRQFGNAGVDEILAIAVDASGVYVAGSTQGPLNGRAAAPGAPHAFVRKYDADGAVVWTREFGTGRREEVLAVAIGAAGIFAAGDTTVTAPPFDDGFVAQVRADGTMGWSRWIQTASSDRAAAIAVDAAGVYVAGATDATLTGQTSAGDSDAFLRKFDFAGTELWTRQFGTPGGDEILSMTLDASGLYVVGTTNAVMTGQSAAGEVDAFVTKTGLDGQPLWTRQFGSAGYDDALAVVVTPQGVFVAGNTKDALPGRKNAGVSDAYVRKYDLAGKELWTEQFGTGAHDEVLAVASDGAAVYAVGVSEGALRGATNSGSVDAFVIKLQ
jgi:hypothetical protein